MIYGSKYVFMDTRNPFLFVVLSFKNVNKMQVINNNNNNNNNKSS